ncbi:MAG TPA: ribokinase [Gammaproteobacteria bacterium]|nr:ribokinase [Gammaproteobacteria bacterium]
MSARPSVLVFGSVNVDLVMRVSALPISGETVLTDDYQPLPGGKGANQALAARRAGADSVFVGAVGDDAHGILALALLEQDGVDLSYTVKSNRNTGCAVVMVDEVGCNLIGVASGANQDIQSDQVADELIDQAGVVVLQQEIPIEQNLRLAQRAQHLNTPVLFNLAPATHVPNALLNHVDWLVVNEVEAAFLASSPQQEDITHIAEQLADSHHFNVVVTQGPGSVIAVVDAQILTFPAPAIQAVDTTGAGDTFVGYLAAGIAQGDTGTTHLERAVVAASRACIGLGAQTSIPFGDEVNLL